VCNQLRVTYSNAVDVVGIWGHAGFDFVVADSCRHRRRVQDRPLRLRSRVTAGDHVNGRPVICGRNRIDCRETLDAAFSGSVRSVILDLGATTRPAQQTPFPGARLRSIPNSQKASHLPLSVSG
jgi:hypothetical protein